MLPVRATPIVHTPARKSFLDIDGCVADFHDRLERLDLQPDRVGVDHPWMRPAGADVIRSYRAVWLVTLLGGGSQDHIEHWTRVSCGASDLDSAFADARDCRRDTIDHGRVFDQAFEL